jgi:hypothetical protein
MTKETAIKLFNDRKITHDINFYQGIRELRFVRIGMRNKKNGIFLLLML